MLQRYIFSILIFLFSLVVYANELPKLSCEEILSRVDQAIDPLNKGKNIHSFEINSKTKVSRFGDFELDYQMIFKSPNKFKTTLKVLALDIIIIFNGKDGYLISPLFGKDKLPEKESNSTLQQMQFMNVATKYSKIFSKAEVAAEKEIVNNRECYKIHGMLPDSFSNIPLTLYVDCENFYILRYTMEIAAQNKQALITVNNDDFTEYDGIFMAKKNSSKVGQTTASNIIQSVKFNVDVDDKIFEISNY
ncbi:MAG: hypothetical protein IKD09_06865 [Lentisphaeria bacterium]|nr:hypothetical protein [Lentisphaeria bacterium]